MLEKLEILLSTHDKQPSVILHEGLYCINLTMNMAIIGNNELINKLNNGR